MKKIYLLLIVLQVIITTNKASAEGSFIIGVAPHTSARVIYEMYQPLRQHMETALGIPVEIVTAPDFDTFARRGLKQEYDIAITTGHQARLLQSDGKHIPLLTYKSDFKAVILVANNGPIRKPSDLSNKKVLGLSPASLVTLWGLHWMQDNNISPSSVRYVSASDSVAQLIIAGEAVAGFTSLTNYQKLTPDVQNQLRILSESKPMAGRVYVLNRRHTKLQKKIEDALWAFAETPKAKAYFESNKLEGYRRLRPNELNKMDTYANDVRTLLRDGAK